MNKIRPHRNLVKYTRAMSKKQSQKKSNWIIWIFTAIVLVLLFISFSNKGSSNTLPTTNVVQTNIAPSLDEFKTNYQNSLIKSCEKSVSEGMCTCMGNYLVTNYSDTVLMTIPVGALSSVRSPELEYAVSACLSSGNPSDQSVYETVFGNNLMSTCNSDGTLYAQCSCSLTYLRNNYTLAQIIRADADYLRTKQAPQMLLDAANACVHQ